MRIAVITLTTGGLILAQRLHEALTGECDVYVLGRPDGGDAPGWPAHRYHGPLSGLVAGLWDTYRGIVFISAVGIAVRVCAPFLKDKRTDPAVVVVDERGEYAISLLSGHWGGANDLARRVASVLGANPVVTTATDGQGKMGLDVLARRLGLVPDPFAGIKQANAALVNGQTVAVYCEPNPVKVAQALGEVPPGLALRALEEMGGAPPGLKVALTSLVLPEPILELMYLRPRHLVVGVGCRKGTPAGDILAAIQHACRTADRSCLSILSLASVSLKEDEAGLHEAAATMGVPLKLHSVEDINKFMEGKPELNSSAIAYRRIGVKAVCEPASLMETGNGRRVLPKTIWGKVTVAIAAADWP
ncbi:hypothetical protein SY88_00590 [Clostridiales bacterium PH28_bin88]|nr:hypothetical protein SY88_00590 [Clostridiales bacterium PH28_bin88]